MVLGCFRWFLGRIDWGGGLVQKAVLGCFRWFLGCFRSFFRVVLGSFLGWF